MTDRRDGLTLVEVLIVVAVLTVGVLVALPAVRHAFYGRDRAACAANMKQLSLSLRMYANEYDYKYPPVGWWHGVPEDCRATPVVPLPKAAPVGRLYLSFDMESMYPKYLSDASALICPNDRDVAPDDLRNPVSGAIDVEHRCAAPCRGWALGNSSYTYIGSEFDHDVYGSVASQSLLNLLPFAGDPTRSFWTDAVLTWNRDHPDRMVKFAADGRGTSVPLDVHVVAWAQVLGDTIKRGDPQAVGDLVRRYVALGVPSSSLAPGESPGLPGFAARINDTSQVFINGTRGADFNWSSAYAELAEVTASSSDSTPLLRGIFRVRGPVRACLFTKDYVPQPWVAPPVLWDKLSMDPTKRRHSGGFNVLYFDGHVEFHPYDWTLDENPPFTEAAMWTIAILQHWVDEQARMKTGVAAIDAQCP